METRVRILVKFLHVLIFYAIGATCHLDDEIEFQTGHGDKTTFAEAKPVRYLLYDVNPPEGFNLRRDVYMRVANLIKSLNEDEPWVLVLPPWGNMYHWRSGDVDQNKLPWSTFFELDSLRKHVPVIEFEDYLKVRGESVIDEIYYLQGYKGGWTKWEEKMDIAECLGRTGYRQDEDGRWRNWFFGYEEVYAKKFECLSYMGDALFIKPFLMKNTTGRAIMLPQAETLLHDHFGSTLYWQVHPLTKGRDFDPRQKWGVQQYLLDCELQPQTLLFYPPIARRSMVFAKYLRDLGDQFRKEFLASTDEEDKTVLEDWTEMKRNHGDALGGPYIAAHLRRKDFVHARQKELPSLKKAAEKMKSLMKKYKVKKVFVATDATDEEFEELQGHLQGTNVYRYKPSKAILKSLKDGGVAVIDQWIAAHARYFIGSHVSTFSYRIQDEREILGFDPQTTFNRFCGDEDPDCEQPAKWTIIY